MQSNISAFEVTVPLIIKFSDEAIILFLKRKLEIEKKKYSEFETICLNDELNLNETIIHLTEEKNCIEKNLAYLKKELSRENVKL